ncbi:hypothetical protein ATCC90586_004273 [Pythium insidiosum]|nr:hypothetical protein ATCC90586_004273 [Pythium insidiosum]
MDASARWADYELHILSARDDISDTQRHLDITRQQINQAQRCIEDLTIDACSLRVRMKELELDEELVKKSEEEAIMEKIMAQKRLVELGGHEPAVRSLQKALHEAKRELEATKEETQSVIAEEKKMQQELLNLQLILQRSRATSVKLQEEYSIVMREKRESDLKLKQLCLFLHTDAPLSPSSTSSPTSTAALSSPTPSLPSSPSPSLSPALLLPEVHY